MLKITVLAFALILCFGLANASIYLVKPAAQTLNSGDQIELGKIARGETLELIVKSDSGKNFKWNKMELQSGLPLGWRADKSVFYNETVGLKILIPSNAEEGIQNIKLKVFNDQQLEIFESFNAIVLVRANLLSVQITKLKQETLVDQPVSYKVSLLNDSIAEHKVIVSSTLPNYWMQEQKVELNPKELKELTVEVNPKTYGFKNFNFLIISELNGFELKSIPAELTVNPTLASKYSTAFYGLPFFSPTFFPYYLINSFISLAVR